MELGDSRRPLSVTIVLALLAAPVFLILIGNWLLTPFHANKILFTFFAGLPVLFVLYRAAQRDRFARLLVAAMCVCVVATGSYIVIQYFEQDMWSILNGLVDGSDTSGLSPSVLENLRDESIADFSLSALGAVGSAVALIVLFLPGSNRWYQRRT